jgi:hypothetical protein
MTLLSELPQVVEPRQPAVGRPLGCTAHTQRDGGSFQRDGGLRLVRGCRHGGHGGGQVFQVHVVEDEVLAALDYELRVELLDLLEDHLVVSCRDGEVLRLR